VAVTDENNKSTVSTNGIKTTAKQQNVDAVQGSDAKKKQLKTNAAPALNKQQSTGKSILKIKLNYLIKSFICR
jgi:hypothetical protein